MCSCVQHPGGCFVFMVGAGHPIVLQDLPTIFSSMALSRIGPSQKYGANLPYKALDRGASLVLFGSNMRVESGRSRSTNCLALNELYDFVPPPVAVSDQCDPVEN